MMKSKVELNKRILDAFEQGLKTKRSASFDRCAKIANEPEMRKYNLIFAFYQGYLSGNFGEVAGA